MNTEELDRALLATLEDAPQTPGRLLRFPEPAVRAHRERAEAAAIAFAAIERKPILLRSVGLFLALGAAALTTASLLAAVALAATHPH